MLILGIRVTKEDEDIQPAMKWCYTKSMWNALEYLKLGFHQILTNLFDWVFTILLLKIVAFSVYDHKANEDDTIGQIVLLNIIGVCMQVSKGIEQAITIIIGHQIGYFNIKLAKSFYRNFKCFFVCLILVVASIVGYLNIFNHVLYGHIDKDSKSRIFRLIHDQEHEKTLLTNLTFLILYLILPNGLKSIYKAALNALGTQG